VRWPGWPVLCSCAHRLVSLPECSKSWMLTVWFISPVLCALIGATASSHQYLGACVAHSNKHSSAFVVRRAAAVLSKAPQSLHFMANHSSQIQLQSRAQNTPLC